MRSLVFALLVIALLPACATRSVNTDVVSTHDLEVRLRSEKPTFGWRTVARGFDHPAEISPVRLEAILSGIQIDMRPSDKSAIRERRYAIPRKLIPEVAEGVSRALAEAGPDQEIVVLALRKQMQKAFFNRKYLTSFVAWVEGEDLIVHLSHVDWKTEQHRRGDKMSGHWTDSLPKPQVGEHPMSFNTVDSDLYALAGRQGVRVAWRSEAFGTETIEQNVAGQRTGADPLAEGDGDEAAAGDDAAPDVAAPTAGAAGAAAVEGAARAGEAGAATLGDAAAAAGSAAGVASEAGVAAGAAAAGAASGAGAAVAGAEAAEPGDALRGLTADDLRRLADLEEARMSGRISRSDYELQRRAILDGDR